MVAQPPRRADDDLRALLEGAPFGALVHAADAGGDARAGIVVEPLQFSRDLQRQFARRRDDEAERRLCLRHHFAGAHQVRAHGEAESHGLAGACLGGDQNVTVFGVGAQHGGLNRGRGLVMALGERPRQLRRGFEEGQFSVPFYFELPCSCGPMILREFSLTTRGFSVAKHALGKSESGNGS